MYMKTTTKVTFGKFERINKGDDCNGKDVFINGVYTLRARITREITWADSATSWCGDSYKVTGYQVQLGDEDEVLVETLGEAHKLVKDYLAKQPVEQHIAECMMAMVRAIRTYRTRWGNVVEGQPGDHYNA